MDIAEKMAADIALAIDGGDWQDAKWFSKFHREAWIKAVQPYADEIERLREEISELKYKEAYASRAYMAARRMLDERGIHMDYFLSRANYESEVKDKNNGWIPQ